MKVLCKFIAILLLFACEVASSSESNYDIVAKLDSGPGNVTVMDNGRIIMSMHQFYQPKYTVVEYKNKTLVPFPNEELAAADSTAALKLDSVLGTGLVVNVRG
jgi:hypothetical protein